MIQAAEMMSALVDSLKRHESQPPNQATLDGCQGNAVVQRCLHRRATTGESINDLGLRVAVIRDRISDELERTATDTDR